MEKIKVLIADDHRVVREGLAAILKTKDDIQRRRRGPGWDGGASRKPRH